MEELAKAIQKKYIEDISSKYPLYRFVCLLILLIASYAYSNNNDQLFIETISAIKVGFIFDFKSGLLPNITIGVLAICLMLVLGIHSVYSILKDKAFNLLSKTSDYQQYIKEIESSISCQKSSNEALNYFLSKDISKQLDKSRIKIRSLHSFSEIIFSVLVAFIWGIEYWGVGEILISIACVGFIVWNQWRSFNYYVSAFIPYYVTERVLLGGEANFGEQ